MNAHCQEKRFPLSLFVENVERVKNYIEETSCKRDLSLLNYTIDKNASSNISSLIHTIADSLWVLSVDLCQDYNGVFYDSAGFVETRKDPFVPQNPSNPSH